MSLDLMLGAGVTVTTIIQVLDRIVTLCTYRESRQDAERIAESLEEITNSIGDIAKQIRAFDQEAYDRSVDHNRELLTFWREQDQVLKALTEMIHKVLENRQNNIVVTNGALSSSLCVRQRPDGSQITIKNDNVSGSRSVDGISL